MKPNEECAICKSLGDICVSCEESAKAGGEVEVLATVDRMGALVRHGVLYSVELVDRAHVTRLQAELSSYSHHDDVVRERNDLETELMAVEEERDAPKAEVELLKYQLRVAHGTTDVVNKQRDHWMDKCHALQSELTKARELMEKAAYMIECPNLFFGSEKPDMIKALTAHQSAPAAKDGEHSRTKRNLNADPHCPECGHPDCNGQCFGDDMMGDS